MRDDSPDTASAHSFAYAAAVSRHANAAELQPPVTGGSRLTQRMNVYTEVSSAGQGLLVPSAARRGTHQDTLPSLGWRRGLTDADVDCRYKVLIPRLANVRR